MTLLKEILKMNESITFELDITDDVNGAIEKAKKLGATNIKAFDTNARDSGMSLTVKNKEMGNKVINLLYGPDDNSRDSNNFFMGLED